MSDNSQGKSFGFQLIITVAVVCFFLSGVTGLMYELLWTRMLGLFLGNTTHAVTAMLIAFMAGLGLGGFIMGQVLERRSLGIRFYGILELALAAYALSTPFLLRVVESVYIAWHPGDVGALWWLTTIRFALSLMVFFIPAALMGATLPVMVTALTPAGTRARPLLGLFYGVNTLGAMTGAMLAGWWLIPVMGIEHLLLMTAGINTATGAAAIAAGGFPAVRLNTDGRHNFDTAPGISQQTGTGEANDVSEARKGHVPPLLLLMFLGITGAGAMILEIGWTRALILLLGGSTYAFSTVLTAFLAGIGLGSLCSRFAWVRRRCTPMLWFCLQIATAAASVLFIVVYPAMHLRYPGLIPLFGQNFNLLLSVQFLCCSLVLLLPAFGMGLSFPVACELYRRSTGFAGASIGNSYAWVTLGNVVGAAVGGLVLLPAAGTLMTLKIAAFCYLVAGTAGMVWYFRSDSVQMWKPAALLAACSLIIALPAWGPNILNLGTAVYAGEYLRNPLLQYNRLYHNAFRYFREGDDAVVAVIQQDDSVTLTVNGKADASTDLDMIQQILLGYLPMAYHSGPVRDVLVIGLGSGVTSSVPLLFEDVHQVISVELVDEVAQAAGEFAVWNSNVIDNPRHEVIIEDGRSFLKTTARRFDCIISEPSNPWIAGIGNLFTSEYYRLCKSRLKPGGVICQWLQAYNIAADDYQMILNTFAANFRYCHIWTSLHNDTLFIGSDTPLVFHAKRLERVVAGSDTARSHFSRVLRSRGVAGIFAYFVLATPEIKALIRNNRLNSDAFPRLEFNAPRYLYRNSAGSIDMMLRSRQQDVHPPLDTPEQGPYSPAGIYYDVARTLYRNGLLTASLDYADMAFRENPTPATMALRALIQYQVSGKKGPEFSAPAKRQAGLEIEYALRKRPFDPDIIRSATEFYLLTDRQSRIFELSRRPVDWGLLGPETVERMAETCLKFGDFSGMKERFEWCDGEYPAMNSYYQAKLAIGEINMGLWDDAVSRLREVSQDDPLCARTWYLLGVAYLKKGDNDSAERALLEAVSLMPAHIDAVCLLARIEGSTGRRAAAVSRLEVIRRMVPENPEVRKELESLPAEG